MTADREAGMGGARRCAHLHPPGKPCGDAFAGAAVCVAQSAGRADRRVAVRQRGGQVGKAIVMPESRRSMRLTEDVLGLTQWTTALALTGHVDVRIAYADDGLANAAGRFRRAIEDRRSF